MAAAVNISYVMRINALILKAFPCLGRSYSSKETSSSRPEEAGLSSNPQLLSPYAWGTRRDSGLAGS